MLIVALMLLFIPPLSIKPADRHVMHEYEQIRAYQQKQRAAGVRISSWRWSEQDQFLNTLEPRLKGEERSRVLIRDFPVPMIARYGLPPANGFALRCWSSTERYGYLVSWAEQPACYTEGRLSIYPLELEALNRICKVAAIITLLALALFVLNGVWPAAGAEEDEDFYPGRELGLMPVVLVLPLVAHHLLSIGVLGLGLSGTGLSGYVILPLVPAVFLAGGWMLLVMRCRCAARSLRALVFAAGGALLAMLALLTLGLLLKLCLYLGSGGQLLWIEERVGLLLATVLPPGELLGAGIGLVVGWRLADGDHFGGWVMGRLKSMAALWPAWGFLLAGVVLMLTTALAILPTAMHW